MKIAVIGIRGLPDKYSGFETCAANTTSYWAKDAEVLVYCRKRLYDKKIDTNEHGVNMAYIPCLSSKSLETLSHTFLCCLHLIFFNRSYKIIHLYNCANGLFIPLLRLFGFKTVISVDGIEWKRKKWSFIGRTFFKIGAFFSVKSSNAIVTDNSVVYDYYLNTYNKHTNQIAYGAKSVCSNAKKELELLKSYSLKKNCYYIFIGRFVPEKGVLNLIESYLKTSIEIPLVIVGDDSSNSEYRNQIFNQYKDNPRIKLLGYIYGSHYEMLLKNALMYVSASELEGTSPSLLMAMKAKVPCLVNGIPENIATAQDTVCYFEKNNYGDLTRKLISTYNNKKDLLRYSSAAFAHVNKNYSWSDIASQYFDLFKKL
ncbi:MAG: glycosyltransferase [Flavobacteriaceae bacterium]|nr:glycosyltransferase [Flavobacteriaceae bacterium]